MAQAPQSPLTPESPEAKSGLPILEFKTDRLWDAWLAGNHAGSKGIWLRISRKAPSGSTRRTAAKDDNVDKARYAILWRIQTAKKPETRSLRIKTFIAMLKRKEKLYP